MLMGLMTMLVALSLDATPEHELLWTIVEETALTEAAETPFVYELELMAGFHATGNAPETSLYVDEETGELLLRDLFMPRAAEYYPVVMTGLLLDSEWGRGLGLRLRVDSGELYAGGHRLYGEEGLASNGQPIADEATSTGFVRELVASLSGSWGYLLVGKQQAMVLNGLVYGDYGFGASLHTDLEALGFGPFSADFRAQAVGYSWSDYASPNPLFGARLTWHHGFFENISLEAALFVDRSDVFADALISMPIEWAIRGGGDPIPNFSSLLEAESEGVMRYLGVSGHHFFAERLSFQYAVAWQTGSLHTSRPDPLSFIDDVRFGDVPPREADLAFDAWAATAELHWSISQKMGVALFGVGMTGQSPPDGQPTDVTPMTVFVSPAPYWAWSGLFFSGMLNQGYLASRSNTAGINGHGVWVLGAKADIAVADSQNLVRLLWLEADEPRPAAPEPGRPPDPLSQQFTSAYGFEVDWLLDVPLYEWDGAEVILMTELDVLFAGDFFREESVGYRFMGQLRIDYGG